MVCVCVSEAVDKRHATTRGTRPTDLPRLQTLAAEGQAVNEPQEQEGPRDPHRQEAHRQQQLLAAAGTARRRHRSRSRRRGRRDRGRRRQEERRRGRRQQQLLLAGDEDLRFLRRVPAGEAVGHGLCCVVVGVGGCQSVLVVWCWVVFMCGAYLRAEGHGGGVVEGAHLDLDGALVRHQADLWCVRVGLD